MVLVKRIAGGAQAQEFTNQVQPARNVMAVAISQQSVGSVSVRVELRARNAVVLVIITALVVIGMIVVRAMEAEIGPVADVMVVEAELLNARHAQERDIGMLSPAIHARVQVT